VIIVQCCSCCRGLSLGQFVSIGALRGIFAVDYPASPERPRRSYRESLGLSVPSDRGSCMRNQAGAVTPYQMEGASCNLSSIT
jgi:hypothetical protein